MASPNTARNAAAEQGVQPPAPLRAEGRTLRCPDCALVQYMTSHGNCRRCHRPLEPKIAMKPQISKAVEFTAVKNVLAPIAALSCRGRDLTEAFAVALRLMRDGLGMSQRELAVLIKVPRTYISKLERGTSLPTPGSVCRITKAIGFPVATFIRMIEILQQPAEQAH